jgi:trigger factor
VAKLADAPDLGSGGATRGGSSPSIRTTSIFIRESDMQVKKLKHDGLNYELEVTVRANDIDKRIDERLEEVGKTLRLPGFRPGKVPLPILKQRYGKAVLGDVLELTVNDSTAKALEKEGLRPALQPKIEVKTFGEGEDLTYTVAVEVLPEFKITDLKKLSLEKPVAEPEDKTIDESLDRIASQNSETEIVTEDRKTKKGDIAVINFKGRTAAGKEYPGMSGENHYLELGSNQFIPGFEEQLIGKKKGDKSEVTVTFPEPYHMAELAGEDAIFDVELKEIHTIKKAEINDAFAKKLGMADKTALRKAVKDQIQKEYSQLSRMKLKRQLLDQLDEEHDFEVPQGMLDLEFSNILEQIKRERQSQAAKGEPELEPGEEKELRDIAGRRVRLGMILSEIGRANNIRISDQEMQRAVIAEAQRYPGQEAEVFEFFRSNRQALESLKAPVFEDKVVDFILELAKVTEKKVTVDDLQFQDDESYTPPKKGQKSGGKTKEKEADSSASKAKSGKTSKK